MKIAWSWGLIDPQWASHRWCDDWRPPLYWVECDDPKEEGAVLMYDRRNFCAEDCEQLSTSLMAVEELLVDAHEA